MQKKSGGPHTVLLIAIAAIIVGISAYTFQYTISLIGKPYPGFVLYPNGIIAPSQPIGGVKNPKLKYPAYVVEAGGKAVSTSDEVYALAGKVGAGVVINYKIRDGSREFEAWARTAILTLPDYVTIFGIQCLFGVVSAMLGLFFHWIAVPSSSARYLVYMSFSLGFFSCVTPDFFAEHRLYVVPNPSTAVIPPIVILFALSFPEERRILRKAAFHWLLWAQTAVVGAGFMFGYYKPSRYLLVESVVIVEALIAAAVLVGSVVRSMLFSESPTARKRARVVAWGAVFSIGIFIPSFTMMYIFGIPEALFFWSCSLIMFALTIAYASLKHNIFEVDETVRNWAGYIISLAVLSAMYIAILSLLNLAFSRVGQGQFLSSIISALFIVMVFIPVRNRLKLFVDRNFFREAYESQRIVEESASALVKMFDLGQVASRLVDTVFAAIKPARAMLLLPDGDGFSVACSIPAPDTEIPRFGPGHPLIFNLAFVKKGVVLRDEPGLPGGLPSAMSRLDAAVAVPFIYKGALRGALLLGEKISGAGYTSVDTRLLRLLADQALLAMENARLLEEEREKERMSLELETARKVQGALFPEAEPSVKGLDVSSACLPAREVSGDYYDYIAISGSEVGMAVGDVVGKGVPAALTMSMIKGAYQGCREIAGNPAGMLRKLNEVACGSRTRQLATLFSCVISTESMTMRYSNAGHNFPYIVRGGGAEFLGEAVELPLGSNPETAYAESSLALRRGDVLVLYTDGLVEAMAGGEMFGFKRLEESVIRHSSLDPGEMKRRIIEDVSAFAGGEGQADDITLVILKLGD
jgi:sigma-B regulation protein RsbU (phosphoserine phosphatase)